MRFVCDSCRAQYMISDDKVGAKGVKVRCKKCGYVILVRKAEGNEETTQVAPMPQAPPAAATAAFGDSDSLGANPLPAEPRTRPGGDSGAAMNGTTASEAPALGPPADGPPANGATAAEMPANGAGAGENGTGAAVTSFGGSGQSTVLGGVEDDEIGAVFDQVLKSAPQKVQPDVQGMDSLDVPLSFDDREDDLSSTRVVPADALRKLAQESVQFSRGDGQPAKDGGGNGAEVEKGASSVPENDWFVAVDDQQQGPLSLEKLKDMWERGEVGPDSLCWRSGYSDWTALSEVEALRQVLAPKPQKPVIAASPALIGPASGAVVTVPVESSFNVGGMAQTVRAEVPMMAAAPAAETGGWQPSAASALASLVKEEMSVLSKPAPARRSLLEISQNDAVPEHGHGGGLLDLPPAPPPGPAPAGVNGHPPNGFLDLPAPAAGAPAPARPAYAASSYPSYPPPPAPQPGMSRGLMIALGGVAFLLLATIGTVLFVFLRPSAPVPAVSPTQVAKLEMPPPPEGLRESPPAPPAAQPAAPAQPPVAVPTSPPAVAAAPPPIPTPAPVPAAVPSPPIRRARGSPSGSESPRASGGEEEVITPRSKSSAGTSPSNPDDEEFDSLFGKPGKGSSGSSPESETGKKPKAYIPPAPGSGGGSLKEALGTSDVMQVVLSNKPRIVECVQQQKAKQPGLSGKLVMKWTILPSGKTSGVSVQSDELRSTYMASCISALIKGMSFPRHRVQGEPIVFPFTF